MCSIGDGSIALGEHRAKMHVFEIQASPMSTLPFLLPGSIKQSTRREVGQFSITFKHPRCKWNKSRSYRFSFKTKSILIHDSFVLEPLI